MELKRVVVTGLGAVTPLGNTAAETWKNMVAGVSGAGPITKFDTEKFKTKFACEVKDFDPTKFIDRKETRKMDPYCQYALSAATMAVEDCGMDLEAVDKNRIGVVFGVGIGGMKTYEEEVAAFTKTGETIDELLRKHFHIEIPSATIFTKPALLNNTRNCLIYPVPLCV